MSTLNEFSGYVAFYKGRRVDNPEASRLDQIICAISGGKFSHCEIVLHYRETGKSVCGSASGLDGGVRVKRIDLNSGHWEVMHYPIDTINANAFFKSPGVKGAKYDFIGLARALYNKAPHSSTRYFCSEICGIVCGIPNPDWLTPSELYYKLKVKMENFDAQTGQDTEVPPGPDKDKQLKP